MTTYRYSCNHHGPTALADLHEVRPGIFLCTACTQRGRVADMAAAAQRARDQIRDAQVNALRGAPIDNRTRADIASWRPMKGSAA